MTSLSSGFQEGMSDGCNGCLNRNVGSLTPSPDYQVGYYLGYKKFLLFEKGVYTNHDDFELVVEYKCPANPLSSPASYRIEQKTAIPGGRRS